METLSDSPAPLKESPLAAVHARLSARMVPFAGWRMPLQYRGILEEHRAVREGAGLFDVSHMGEFDVEGPGALGLLQELTPNDVARLRQGRAHYSALLTPRGTFLDDILVYCLDRERYLVVVNAANTAADLRHVEAEAERRRRDGGAAVTIRDVTGETALLALQGPRAVAILESAYEPPAGGRRPEALKYYGFVEGGLVGGAPVRVVSRTGYTGEDGFEIYMPAAGAPAAFEALAGDGGATPAGLGARDTLRLEAGMCLYGQDIDAETTPVEAGLEWTVKPDKGDFIGREVLVRQMAEGPPRRLVGLAIEGRSIARPGHEVLAGGEIVGRVTSGTHSPTLGRPIALALVRREAASVGAGLAVDVRGRLAEARVVALPFYSGRRAAAAAEGRSA